jgi:formic-like protein
LAYDCKNIKIKAKVLELLGAVCLVLPNGHDLVVEAFHKFQQYKQETFRFQTLVADLNTDELEFQIVCMALISTIVNSPEERDIRIVLRYEFLDLGIDRFIERIKTSEISSDELFKHISVFEEEAKVDFEDAVEDNDIPEMSQVDQTDPDDIYATIKATMMDSDSHFWLLRVLQKLFIVNNLNSRRR